MSLDISGFVKKKTTLNLGGKDFVFTEINLADFAQFSAWAKERRNKEIEKKRSWILQTAKDVGVEDTGKLMDMLTKPITEDEIDLEMTTLEGIGYIAYLSLKHHYPEVSQDEVMQILTAKMTQKVLVAALGEDEEKSKKKPRTRQPVKTQ